MPHFFNYSIGVQKAEAVLAISATPHVQGLEPTGSGRSGRVVEIQRPFRVPDGVVDDSLCSYALSAGSCSSEGAAGSIMVGHFSAGPPTRSVTVGLGGAVWHLPRPSSTSGR